MQRVDRRHFLLRSSTCAGAMLLASQRTFGTTGPNDLLNLGIVGCGIRGNEHLAAFAKITGVRIAGICDPDRVRLERAAPSAADAKRWTDLRDMFHSAEIDAVVIATCNHWHALAAIWALEAGKHVYVEKPLSLTHWEGRQLLQAAKKSDRIVQVGTQQRSDPMQQELKQFLHHDGVLGEIQWVLVNRFGVRGPIGKRKTPLEPPKSIDYDLWLGPAEDLPIYRNSLHYDWHWVWNTGSGEMGNWGIHMLDDVRNVVFNDRVKIPRKLVAAGDRIAWHDAGDTPNLQFVVLEADTTPVVASISNLSNGGSGDATTAQPGPGSGYVVYCENGRLEGQRGEAAAFDQQGNQIRKFTGNTGERAHRQNFVDAVRSHDSSLLAAPVEVAHYSTAWCNLANIVTSSSSGHGSTTLNGLVDEFQLPAAADVYRHLRQLVEFHGGDPKRFALGPVVECDPETERFTGETAQFANHKLRRVDRAAFTVPDFTADAS